MPTFRTTTRITKPDGTQQLMEVVSPGDLHALRSLHGGGATAAVAAATAATAAMAEPGPGPAPGAALDGRLWLAGNHADRDRLTAALTASGVLVGGLARGRKPPHIRFDGNGGGEDEVELAQRDVFPEEVRYFDSAAYFAELGARYPCQLVLYANVIGSTQTLLESHPKLCAAAGNGLVCCAAMQRAGRGRRTNQWESPNGCLMFSFGWQHKDPKTVVFIQYLFGLALVDSVRSRNGYEDVALRLKWPNDIYYGDDNIKVGGILVSSSFEAGAFNLVIGCGFNISNEKPTTCLDSILSEDHPELPKLRSEAVLAAALTTFSRYYTDFAQEGFAPFLEKYYSRWIHSGQQVDVLKTAASESAPATTQQVVIRGVTQDGYLYAADIQVARARAACTCCLLALPSRLLPLLVVPIPLPKIHQPSGGRSSSRRHCPVLCPLIWAAWVCWQSGARVELEPDGNTFDMMKGLIQRKR